MLFGSVPKTVRAVEFWAKSGKDAYFTATSGATLLGRQSLIPDRGWHRYVVPFSQDLLAGSPLVLAMGFTREADDCQGNIADRLCPVVVDSLVLIARPFETVSVVSDNVFYAPTSITATVSGRWSTDPHFMSVTSVLGGAPACALCTHVLVPANGAYGSFRE